jgi:hypothetical protein
MKSYKSATVKYFLVIGQFIFLFRDAFPSILRVFNTDLRGEGVTCNSAWGFLPSNKILDV